MTNTAHRKLLLYFSQEIQFIAFRRQITYYTKPYTIPRIFQWINIVCRFLIRMGLQQCRDNLIHKICRQHCINTYLVLLMQLTNLTAERITPFVCLERAISLYIITARAIIAYITASGSKKSLTYNISLCHRNINRQFQQSIGLGNKYAYILQPELLGNTIIDTTRHTVHIGMRSIYGNTIRQCL